MSSSDSCSDHSHGKCDKSFEYKTDVDRVLNGQIDRALARNRADDIFKDLKSKGQSGYTNQEVAGKYVQYKFAKVNIIE